MKTQFYILLSLKNRSEFKNYGQFSLGNNRQAAQDIFSKLRGNQDYCNEALLHFDFMETVDHIPVLIRTLCCTLEEYVFNCKLLALETFKQCNLE